jgi:GlpG protein
MRHLTSFDDPEIARALSEVLYAANIDSDVRVGEGNACSLWVLSERDLPRAEAILRAFVAQPPRAAHKSVPAPPKAARRTLGERAKQSPVTYALLAICAIVALLTHFGEKRDLVSQLTIASFERSVDLLRWDPYRDLLHGELWRLITPIFIHFGVAHLVLNGMCVMDLGAATERFQGRWHHTALVLWSAAVSNMAQLVFGRSPLFGGMSGVVYAYIGYLWLRGRADPSSGIHLPTSWLAFWLGWMALGFSGLLNSVVAMANYAHLGGLLAGGAYGYVAALIARRRRA